MPHPTAADRDDLMEKTLMRCAVGAGAMAAGIGGYHLFLWLSGSLTHAGLHSLTMKSNGALCLMLHGIAVALAVPKEGLRARRMGAGALAGLATLIAALTLIEHLFGVDLGIDQLISREQAGAVGVTSPNRMGPPAALSLSLCGVGVLFLLRGGRHVRLAQGIGIALCLIALLGILGYFYRVEGLYAAPRLTGIARPTTVSILLLGLALLFARPREAVMAVFTSGTPGGVASRRLLLPAIVFPILLGWLRLQGELRGFFGFGFGTSILVLSWIVIFSFLVYQIGKRAEAQQMEVEDQLARESLRQSEQRLKSVIDNMAEGVIVFDPSGASLHWNRKALEFLPYREALDRASLAKLETVYEMRTLEGELLATKRWPVSRILQGEELHDLELVLWEKEHDRKRVLSYSGLLIRNSEGIPAMGLLNFREITEKKEAEEALRASEELLRTVLETLPVGVWIMNADGAVQHANRAAEEIWRGAPRVEIDEFGLYKGWRTDTGERIAAEQWGGARAIRKGETSLNEEVEIECFDGTHKIILNSSVPLRDHRGKITGAITVNQDITGSKQALDALRESENKFRAIFQQAAVGMGRVSFHDGRWIDVNDAFCRMLGYSAEEMRATPWPQITHPEDLDLDLVPFRQMAAGDVESYSVEKRFIHRDRHEVWARLTLSLVRDPQGNPDYEIAIIEDISARKQAEEALHNAKDELELRVRERTRELEEAYAALQREVEKRLAAVEDLREKEQLLVQQSRMAAMGEMLGNIAHQWRQPLNILGLLVQQLQLTYQKGTMSAELMREEVAKAMNVIRHMSQTINDFKDFLKQEKETEIFSINSAVITTITLLEAPLKGMNVEFEVNQGEELQALGHRNEFSHVIMNLITNARDAFREREVAAPKIVIKLFREEGKPVVTVADNAGGIPEEILGRVFEPYFTTKGPDKGTGIGLFMSRNIIEKSMGGRLSVRNTEEGAEFRIEFEELPQTGGHG